MTAPHKAWTKEEDAIISKHYSGYGAPTCAIFLRNRTNTLISRRASTLGIKRSKKDGRIWSDAEKDIIRKYYPNLGAVGCADKLPKRSVASIQKMAAKLSVVMTTKAKHKTLAQLKNQNNKKKYSIDLRELSTRFRENRIQYLASCKAWI